MSRGEPVFGRLFRGKMLSRYSLSVSHIKTMMCVYVWVCAVCMLDVYVAKTNDLIPMRREYCEKWNHTQPSALRQH